MEVTNGTSGTAEKAGGPSPAPSLPPSPINPTLRAGSAHEAPRTIQGLGEEMLRAVEKPVNMTILATLDTTDYLPGQPRIQLSSSQYSYPVDEKTGQRSESSDFMRYLKESHLTTKLDKLIPFMKYVFVSLLSIRFGGPLVP